MQYAGDRPMCKAGRRRDDSHGILLVHRLLPASGCAATAATVVAGGSGLFARLSACLPGSLWGRLGGLASTYEHCIVPVARGARRKRVWAWASWQTASMASTSRQGSRSG
ncbi:hypothetical protein LX32DRAFT_644647 [Colletotrichum zoysiae]|uniref:Uncharacterized protein n=1 Tax=Colletotrichum zoysiae TaxID=1216348 RepID=A0AAD9H8P4_9PEZI|nr:hypothetical protein LX32DRAFT_644647 [Colletotrichum zoysiae]